MLNRSAGDVYVCGTWVVPAYRDMGICMNAICVLFSDQGLFNGLKN